jgi:hypothetical protein
MRHAALAAAFAVLATPALAQALAAAAPALYVCIYKAGPAWQAGKPLSAQGLAPHGAYMKRLFDEGRLLAGGPITDADGGMAIVRAASMEDAKAVFAADPAVTAGIMAAEVHRWTPVFDARKLAKP